MPDHIGTWRCVLFQHVLDQVNPTARAIQLVTENYVCRAGGRAKPAMDAAPQNALCFLNVRVDALTIGKFGLQLPLGLDSHSAGIE